MAGTATPISRRRSGGSAPTRGRTSSSSIAAWCSTSWSPTTMTICATTASCTRRRVGDCPRSTTSCPSRRSGPNAPLSLASARTAAPRSSTTPSPFQVGTHRERHGRLATGVAGRGEWPPGGIPPFRERRVWGTLQPGLCSINLGRQRDGQVRMDCPIWGDRVTVRNLLSDLKPSASFVGNRR